MELTKYKRFHKLLAAIEDYESDAVPHSDDLDDLMEVILEELAGLVNDAETVGYYTGASLEELEKSHPGIVLEAEEGG